MFPVIPVTMHLQKPTGNRPFPKATRTKTASKQIVTSVLKQFALIGENKLNDTAKIGRNLKIFGRFRENISGVFHKNLHLGIVGTHVF